MTNSFTKALSLMAVAATLSSLSLVAFAEDEQQYINREQHQENQLQRDKGELNGQYNHLQNREARINRQDQRDMARHGGHLTPQERRRLDREQNQEERAIRRDHRRVEEGR